MKFNVPQTQTKLSEFIKNYKETYAHNEDVLNLMCQGFLFGMYYNDLISRTTLEEVKKRFC
jgi:hypothetical protein